ncbi:circadian locomoter output cycles protein kaput isoform X2 [Thrips palmi]|uniref:Circadian locomoter output cycles protein kaput isoform X2 n=1 Tax=Thrips palmi TaxID=161013 RepID=A0A6P9ADD3_THRPL|nr:circadian locomoter output cycles protein kaput isoform X2 [Thrips palmi]
MTSYVNRSSHRKSDDAMDDDTDDKDDTKRKSRNLSEKKRRDQFNMLINELSSMVSTNNRKMDKSTVLKSTISFLKNHNEISVRSRAHEIQEDWKPSFLSNEEFTHLVLEAVDGFILVFSATGKIFYASESITSLLGHCPNDLLNTSLYDIVYEEDQTDLYNLMLQPNVSVDPVNYDSSKENQLSFACHVRRGGLDCRGEVIYELVQFVGYFRSDIDSHETDNLNSLCMSGFSNDTDTRLIFVGTGRLHQPQLIREMALVDSVKSEFTSRHSLEWKFLFLDHRAPPIIGYLPFEVLGTSGYDYYHVDDLDKVVTCHEALMQKGEGTSCYYRFLTKGQQWIWLQTRFYITYHQWNSKPEFIVCTHRVVNYITAMRQSRGETDPAGDHNGSQDDNENMPLDSDHKLQTVAASSPWSSKSSVGKASRLALTNVSSPAPSGSIVSTGARGRGQMSFHGTGPDSDSNSMSTDSVTSRQSHPRANSHGASMRGQNSRYHSVSQPSTSSGIQHSAEPPAKLLCSQLPSAPSVAVQAMPSMQAVPNIPPAEPPPQAPHPQQFMAAIPVQPVIAGGFSAPAATVSTSAELLSQPVMMSPAQTQYQEQLQRKHEELQQMILQQQQELRLVSDQLLMARYGILPASLLNVSLPYTVASNAVGSTVTQALAPTSIPIPVPASSELFVTPHHHSLVHSPLAVAPPVVVDPQQINLQTGTEDMVPFQLSQQQAQLLLASNFNPNTTNQHRQ